MKKNILTLLLVCWAFCTQAQLIRLEEDSSVYLCSDISFYKNEKQEHNSTIIYENDKWMVVYVSVNRGYFTAINIYYDGKRVECFAPLSFYDCQHHGNFAGRFYFTYNGKLYTNCKGGIKSKVLFHEVDPASNKRKTIDQGEIVTKAYLPPEGWTGKVPNLDFHATDYDVTILKTANPNQFIIYNEHIFEWDEKKGTKPFFVYDISNNSYQKYEAPLFSRLITSFNDEDFFFGNCERLECDSYYHFNSTTKTGNAITGINKKDRKSKVEKIYCNDKTFYFEFEKNWYEVTGAVAVKKEYYEIQKGVLEAMRAAAKNSTPYYYNKYSISYKQDLNKQVLKNYPTLVGSKNDYALDFMVEGYATGLGKMIIFADTTRRSGFYYDALNKRQGKGTLLDNVNNNIIQNSINEKRAQLERAQSNVVKITNDYADCVKRGIDCSSVRPYNKKLYEEFLLRTREYISLLEKNSASLSSSFIEGEKKTIEKTKADIRNNPLAQAAIGL